MFKKTKNIDAAFRQTRSFFIIVICCVMGLGFYWAYTCYRIVSQSQNRVYVLANGKALDAYGADRKDNIPVEARDHINMFHQYFFTLAPDEKLILANITRALYLADETAKKQYDNLKEGNYYSSVISGNVSQRVISDSVSVNTESYPHTFRYYGKLEITRPSSVTLRSLVTEGQLRSVSRSDNNPHGFLIERWRTLENQDINTKGR